MKRRIMSMLLCIVMIFSLLATTANAAICGSCDGKGYITYEGVCSRCRGSGRTAYCSICGDTRTTIVNGMGGSYTGCYTCSNPFSNFLWGTCIACGGGGYTENTVICSDCGGSGYKHYHEWSESKVSATCEEVGYTLHSCSCGETKKSSYTVALGHDYIDGSCSRCGSLLSDAEPFRLTNEFYDGDRIIIYATRAGVTMSSKVLNTNDYFAGVAATPEDDVIYTDNASIIWTVEEAANGYYLIDCDGNYLISTYSGSRKIWNLKENKYLVDHLGQYMQFSNESNQFTCYAPGMPDSRFYMQIYSARKACTHDYEAVVTQPTCLQEGYTTYTCKLCTESYIGDATQALGHTWDGGEIAVEPTATDNGIMVYGCIRCEETKTEIIPALGEEDDSCDGAENCPSNRFTDVAGPNDWTHEGIDFAVKRELFSGMSATRFEPDTPMTRAMLVTVLWRFAGKPTERSGGYVDVPIDSWYTDAVVWAQYHGIVAGVGNHRFDPEGEITREQMVAILYRYATSIGLDTTKRSNLYTYDDGFRVSAYAREAMQWAIAEGLIYGSSYDDGGDYYRYFLQPQGNATRAQVAAILMRFILNVVE